MSRTVGSPLIFVPQPGEGSVQMLFQRLEETAKAAVAEQESNTEETFARDLFRRAMHRSIEIIAGPEGQQRSVGIAWLSHTENRILFRQIVPVEELLAFFKAHLTNRHIVDMLENEGTLRLIPERDRTEFVRGVLGNWIPASDAWIKGALSAQLNRGVLSSAILYWLRHPEDFEGGDAFATRFLRTGAGKALYVPSGYWTLPYSDTTMWVLFIGHDELWEALSICAERVPNVFFEAPADGDIPVSLKVKLRLVEEQSSGLISLAIRNLRSRDGLSATGFDCLTKRLKLAVIRKPEICPLPLLVKFALDYIDLDGYPTFRTYVGQVTRHSTNYAADLVEAFAYIRDARLTWAPAPSIPGLMLRIEQTLRRNAVMHSVDLSTLEL